MNQRELTFFRRLLKRRMQEILSEAGKTVETMDEDENFPDPADRASLEENRNFLLRIRDRALRRLEHGTYGVCEVCGDEINLARLRARPVTTLCIDCKSNQEVEERKYKHLG